MQKAQKAVTCTSKHPENSQQANTKADQKAMILKHQLRRLQQKHTISMDIVHIRQAYPHLPYSSTSMPSISLTGSSTARSDRESRRGPFPDESLSSLWDSISVIK